MNNNQSIVGYVIIGRNEGLRLLKSIESVNSFIPKVIYVDSASTDNSLIEAKQLGVHAISLDMTKSFTAARARNTGLKKMISLFPEVKFVHFIDGDCIVNCDWTKKAVDFLHENPSVAVVCGRRREIFPQRSLYNYMCDQEWNTPIGESKTCGGDALVRVEVIEKVGGYREDLIAGEEPELCVRIRKAGYRVWRIDAEMTLHDAAMTRFGQWWKRATRAGYAFAEGNFLHGKAPEYHWKAESRRALVWGFFLPLMILIILFVNWKLSILFFLIYPLQIVKLAIRNANKKRWGLAFLLVIGKFAEAFGQFKFYKKILLKERVALIEYK